MSEHASTNSSASPVDLADNVQQAVTYETAVARGTRRGALVGFCAAFTVVSLIGIASGLAPGRELSMGVFVGIWSGCGFGAMLGATVSLLWAHDPDTQEPAPPSTPVGNALVVHLDAEPAASLHAQDRRDKVDVR